MSRDEKLSRDKLIALISYLQTLESAVLAYSGGVDSTFLLKALKLSGIRALAVTSASESHPQWDIDDAVLMAGAIGVEHRLIKTCELENREYSSNPPKRCFFCKDELFSSLREIAAKEGIAHVLDGSNADDLNDYRPGLEAAGKHGVKSPLIEMGIGKEEIRMLSRNLGLSTWDKPGSPCLSSRIPYGVQITPEILGHISECENGLRSLGFKQLRVRYHEDVARIELPPGDFGRAVAMKDEIVKALKPHFRHICLDIEGMKPGNFNLDISHGKHS